MVSFLKQVLVGRVEIAGSSSDPNQLQALLSVYPWHIDTLLQMAAIYQQQGGKLGDCSTLREESAEDRPSLRHRCSCRLLRASNVCL